MQTYETIFITPADLPTPRLDEFVEKLKSLVTKQGGEIVSIDKWGRRRLAYPIRRHREGFYIFILFKAPEPVLAEMTQFYRVSEDVIRHMTCKALRGKPASPTMSTAPAAAAPAAPASPVAKEVSHDHPAAASPSGQ